MGDNSVFSGVQGPQGAQGPVGPQGPTGPTGAGVPAGGTALQHLRKIDATDFNTEWADPPSSIFGSEFEQTESEAESTTTASTFQDKIRYNTAALPAGNYRVGWQVEAAQTNTADRVEVLVQVGGVTIAQPQTEPGDVADWDAMSGFKHVALSGVTELLMQFREQAGSTAKVRRARFEIWRVS